MNKLTVFFAILAVLATIASARLHLQKEDEELQALTPVARKGETSSEESEEGLNLNKLSDKDKQELREWAKSVDITWEQIEALSQFQRDAIANPTGENRKEHINKVCKAFDAKADEKAATLDSKQQKEMALLGQTVQLLNLYQQLLTVKEDRQVFVILKDMCHIVNHIQTLVPQGSASTRTLL